MDGWFFYRGPINVPKYDLIAFSVRVTIVFIDKTSSKLPVIQALFSVVCNFNDDSKYIKSNTPHIYLQCGVLCQSDGGVKLSYDS